MNERLKKSIEQLDGGLTLRDQFAMAATEEDIEEFKTKHYYSGVREFEIDGGVYHTDGIETVYFTREQARYRYADAMMEARK